MGWLSEHISVKFPSLVLENAFIHISHAIMRSPLHMRRLKRLW